MIGILSFRFVHGCIPLKPALADSPELADSDGNYLVDIVPQGIGRIEVECCAPRGRISHDREHTRAPRGRLRQSDPGRNPIVGSTVRGLAALRQLDRSSLAWMCVIRSGLQFE